MTRQQGYRHNTVLVKDVTNTLIGSKNPTNQNKTKTNTTLEYNIIYSEVIYSLKELELLDNNVLPKDTSNDNIVLNLV